MVFPVVMYGCENWTIRLNVEELILSNCGTVKDTMDGVCDIVQETGIKTIHMEKKCKKAKWLSEEALQIAMKRRKVKSKGERERYSHLNAEFQE